MMFRTRFLFRNINFYTLCQPASINQHSTITPNAALTKRFCSSVKADPPSLTGSQEDSDDDRKKKLIELEMAHLRDQGHRVPELKFVKPQHWEELLKKVSTSARRKYYQFLFVTEKKVENEKLRRQESARAYQVFKEQKPEVQNKHISYSLGKTTMFLRIYGKTMDLWRNHRLIQAMEFGTKIIYDCSYDEYMSRKEAHSTAKQLMFSFVQNRLNLNPFDLHFCNVNFNGYTFKRLQSLIPTLRSPAYPLNLHEGSYLDHFPKEKLVYLTPHCRNELTEFDPESVYIIGAMVDTRGQEPLSMTKAKEFGLKMARLPLERYLNWDVSADKTLTLDQIMKIMLELKSSRSWPQALKHVPRRKVAHRALYERKSGSQWTTRSNHFGKPFGSAATASPNKFGDDSNFADVEALTMSTAEKFKRKIVTATDSNFADVEARTMSTADKFKRKTVTATGDKISSKFEGNVQPNVAFKRTNSTSTTDNGVKNERNEASSKNVKPSINIKKVFE